MGFFKTKNNCNEYNELLKYKTNISNLLELDKYISRKEYFSFINDNKEIYNKLITLEKEEVLKQWCKKNKVKYQRIIELLNFYENTKQNINLHNDDFINRHLDLDKQYLDELLINDDPNIKLDNNQRKVVLSDEDYTLVIAGAGAGKTTTIEAKVKYLIDKQNIDPNRILIISFTRKATNELKKRCKKLGLSVNIATFHSLANTILNNNESEKHNIAIDGVMFLSIKKYLLENANDEMFVKKILLFFASYLQIPQGEENLSLLLNELSKNAFTTMKSDILKTIEDYKQNQEKKKITIKNEKVKSIEECRIANFLFINGIDYEYEPVYKYGFEDSLKLYCPDFIIRQYDKEIYLEHFGISEDGQNSRFTAEELELYRKHVNDKILLHKKHGTKLIYTFSKYNDGKDTISHLKEELQKAGISFDYRNSKEIYKILVQNIEDKYFNKFIQLICVFITRFKTNNFNLSKFDEWKVSLKDERSKLFINICYQCYLAYTNDLKNNNSIDFEDMINNAANVLDKKIASNEKLPYDYILVDEYQDISMQRFDLCERLSKCSDAKIIAVGDDWQSIFRFSGAKIELFTKFSEMMGYANILKIVNTYRNAQELIDIAGGFIMSNEEQIKKDLKSNKRIDDPIILMSYNDYHYKEEKNSPLDRMCLAIVKSLDMIVKSNGESSSVLLVGRYAFEGAQIASQNKYFTYNKGHIFSNKYPKLKITYLTAHSSKGLGYDNVIIVNGKDAILGFPSKIVDDPLMKLVIKNDDNIEYAEERRLFYVALTRTKNRVYVITPIHRPSEFILEIKDKFKNVVLDGEELKPNNQLKNDVLCPCCGYPLQKRENNSFKTVSTLWICSNDPEVCGFVTNDLKGGKLAISKCPNCTDGYLIVKKIKNENGNETRMLGCTNYKADKTGCNTIMLPHNYTQDKESFMIKFKDNLELDNVVICNHKFKEMVDIIIKEIDKYKQYNTSVGPKMLFKILSGEITNIILELNITDDPYFGCISIDDKQKFYLLFKSLQENGIIKVDENDYGRIILLKDKLDENDYKIILAKMKIR